MVIWTAVAACESPAGADGPEGPEGPVGPAGDDGSMMYAGAGEPDADIGDVDDYYLNQNTGELYGPKGDDGWGNPIIVLMGDNGKDGTQIHDGDGVPDDTLGVIGDFYIDITNQDFYGPKTESGWGDASNLNGEDGTDGVDGSQIYAGDSPPDSSLGDIGDYYLDQTNKDLYGPKTDSGWGAPIDLNGEDGQDGVDGSNGSKILSGFGAPDAFIGTVGDYYLDKNNFDLYGPKTSPNKIDDGWGSPLNLRGTDGADGADGNANVTRYKFSGHDFSSNSYTTLIVSGVDNPELSVWLVYLEYSSMYHVPGWGLNGTSEYRVFSDGNSSSILLQNGPGEVYNNIYLVRIEASNTENLSKQVNNVNLIPDHLDVSDYEEVARYYGFWQ